MPGRNRKYSYDSNNPTVADRYYSESWKVRETFQPIPSETLKTWVIRAGRAVRTAEQDASAHIPWHTHQSAGECWMCVQLQFLNYITTILEDLADSKTIQKYTFRRENQSIRLSIPNQTSKT